MFPWQNTFNFEKRDWMSVKKEELPDGSRLVQKIKQHPELEMHFLNPLTKIYLSFNVMDKNR